MESDGEKVALTWFLHNACTSNVELAVISSVCRRWGEVASLVVASEAVALMAGVEITTASSESSVEGGGGRCIRTLWITDMARELVARQRHQRHERDTTDASEEGGGARSDRARPPNNTGGNFCLAWFAPSGMQTVSVSLEHGSEDDDLLATKTTASATQQRRNGRGKTSKKGKNVSCCPEWRGYRHATEVLIPFGYAKDFIMVSATASSSEGDVEMIS